MNLASEFVIIFFIKVIPCVGTNMGRVGQKELAHNKSLFDAKAHYISNISSNRDVPLNLIG